MTFAGFTYGFKFIRRYKNYLLGLEWIVIGTSGLNVLVWILLGNDKHSIQVPLVYFFDAFSRSFGLTLILVLGLMQVTHRYKPPVAVEIGAFALAIGAGVYLQQFRFPEFYMGPATFYLITNALTTVFLIYFSWRLWQIGAKGLAIGAGLTTAAGTAVALMDDFFRFPGDDELRTKFYIFALAVWGFQLYAYYISYQKLHAHREETGSQPASEHGVVRAVASSRGQERIVKEN
ncbi:transporter [Nocardia rhizosphaerihabitans]